MGILTVYDNKSCKHGLKSAWGFACVVDRRILFDTGGEGSTLLSNMRALGVDLSKIEALVLSHEHWDHTGGVSAFLEAVREAGKEVRVFVPCSFSSGFKQKLSASDAVSEVVEVQPQSPLKILGNAFSTGELGTWTKEQALVLRARKGLVVVTGCAHPGIVNILRYAKEAFNDEILLALGGFHLGSKDVTQAFRRLGVRKVAPCHCTGEVATALLKQAFGADFIENCVGREIEYETL